MPKEFPTHIVAVSGLIENERGELLLLRHKNGRWGWTGGQVENGENLMEALLREIREESGVQAEVGELFAVSSNTEGYPGYGGYAYVQTKVMLDFRCRYIGGEPLQETDETVEAGWFTPQRALPLLISPFAEKFEAYCARAERPLYLSYASKPAFRLDMSRPI